MWSTSSRRSLSETIERPFVEAEPDLAVVETSVVIDENITKAVQEIIKSIPDREMRIA
ncbi:hypothetical protein YTPLAS72_16800 [Nitrospira sp.]|nr:hypothetical protein YTPLAS72_16800 [Nitrospira sp.]